MYALEHGMATRLLAPASERAFHVVAMNTQSISTDSTTMVTIHAQYHALSMGCLSASG
jgi:hypothetical protein